MPMTSTVVQGPYDSYGSNNGVLEYTIAGASGAGGTVTVKAAVASSQIYFKGTLSSSGATVFTLKSGAAGTVLGTWQLAASGNVDIPVLHTKAEELLQLHSSANITAGGIIKTIPVVSKQAISPEWQL